MFLALVAFKRRRRTRALIVIGLTILAIEAVFVVIGHRSVNQIGVSFSEIAVFKTYRAASSLSLSKPKIRSLDQRPFSRPTFFSQDFLGTDVINPVFTVDAAGFRLGTVTFPSGAFRGADRCLEYELTFDTNDPAILQSFEGGANVTLNLTVDALVVSGFSRKVMSQSVSEEVHDGLIIFFDYFIPCRLIEEN